MKETLGLGKKDPSSSAGSSSSSENVSEDGTRTDGGTQEESSQGSSVFYRFKSAISSASPAISSAFVKLKETKVVELAKKGLYAVKEELTSSPASQRKRMQNMYKPTAGEEMSSKRDIVIVPSKQSKLGKKWEAFKQKVSLLTI